jgi:hypothetical protein
MLRSLDRLALAALSLLVMSTLFASL